MTTGNSPPIWVAWIGDNALNGETGKIALNLRYLRIAIHLLDHHLRHHASQVHLYVVWMQCLHHKQSTTIQILCHVTGHVWLVTSSSQLLMIWMHVFSSALLPHSYKLDFAALTSHIRLLITWHPHQSKKRTYIHIHICKVSSIVYTHTMSITLSQLCQRWRCSTLLIHFEVFSKKIRIQCWNICRGVKIE